MSPSPKYHQPFLLDPRYNLQDDYRSFPITIEPTIATQDTTAIKQQGHFQYHHPHRHPHHLNNYYQHIVLPSDTIQGICIRYKISWRKLGQINGFSGKSLGMAPKILWIPKVCLEETSADGRSDSNVYEDFDKSMEIGNIERVSKDFHAIVDNLQDQTSHEFMICYIMTKIDGMSHSDAKRYCEMYNWDLRQIMAVGHGLGFNFMHEKYGIMVKNESKENHYYFRFKASDLEKFGDRNPWMKLRTSLDSLQSRHVSENDNSVMEGRVVETGIEMKDMSYIGHEIFDKLPNEMDAA